MEQDVPDSSYFFEDFWKQADDIPEDIPEEVRALLVSAAFRGLQSREDQLPFLRGQPLIFPYAAIATLFKLSPSAVYRAIRKRDKANDDIQSPERDSLEKAAANMTLSPTEEHTLVAWIESRQRSCDCSSA
jgi:hypothetical protein